MNKKFFILSTGVGGMILIFVLFAILTLFPSDNTDVTLTGTPADNFSEEQRSKFCGTGNATSTNYVKEYKIPTDCTLPQAIITDPEGNIWFIESNTGNLAKFDPVLESFTEYENSIWPKSEHSMMWGMDYAPDGTIWFIGEKYDSIWKFNIQDEKYQMFSFPSEDDSSPQRLEIHGSKLIINDFKGNKLVISDYTRYGENVKFTPADEKSYSYSIPSNYQDGVTADFTIEGENIWYTYWVPDSFSSGVLTKINQTEFDLLVQNDEEDLSIETFLLPTKLKSPNGITADNNGNIWIVDSSSSLFFKFNSTSDNFTQYVTSNPHKSTYGNYTGEIKSPVSRPYWIETDSFGKLVFNEQGSNRIAVFDPDTEYLVEYSIPSKNPHWGDCGDIQNCGLSQVFDFVIKDKKIWFTEWAENNLGVVDTTIPLPIEIHLGEDEISLLPGESTNLNFTISSISKNTLPSVSLILSSSSDFLDVQTNDSPLEIFSPDSFELINLTLYVDDELIPGKYKVLLGAETEQVSVSKFVTVIVVSLAPTATDTPLDQNSENTNGISIAEEADGVLIRVPLGSSDAVVGDSLELRPQLLFGTSTFTVPLNKTLDSTDVTTNTYVDFTIPTGELRGGLNSIIALVTNIAGYVSTASAPLSLTFDDTAPSTTDTPVDQNSENTNGISIAEEADGVLIRIPLGSSGAVVGDSLELHLDGSTFAAPLTKTLDSTDVTTNTYVEFTIPAGELSTGSNFVTAKVTDVAGNAGAASAALTLTFDRFSLSESITLDDQLIEP